MQGFAMGVGLFFECRVKERLRRGEVQFSGEIVGVGGTMPLFHSRIFPFHRERSLIIDSIEFADDFLEVDFTVPRRAEVPSAMGGAESNVASQNTIAAVQHHLAVLDVDMEDAVGELADEFGWVHALPLQVAGVEVEAETRMMADGLQGPLGAPEVKGDFRGMDFQGKIDPLSIEFLQNRRPDFGEFSVAVINHLVRYCGETVEHVPNRRTSEAIDDLDAKVLGCLGGGFHGGNAPGAFRFGIIVTVCGQGAEAVGAFVVIGIESELTSQVVADGPAIQAMLGKQLAFLFTIVGVLGRLEDIKVVAPATKLQAIVADGLHAGGEFFQGIIGPLASENGDGTVHWEMDSVFKGETVGGV